MKASKEPLNCGGCGVKLKSVKAKFCRSCNNRNRARKTYYTTCTNCGNGKSRNNNPLCPRCGAAQGAMTRWGRSRVFFDHCTDCGKPKARNYNEKCKSCFHTSRRTIEKERYIACVDCGKKRKREVLTPRCLECEKKHRTFLERFYSCSECGAPSKAKRGWSYSSTCSECANRKKLTIQRFYNCTDCREKTKDKRGWTHSPRCRACSRLHMSKSVEYHWGSKPSRRQREVSDFISKNTAAELIESDRTILGGREIDILLPKLKLGIEFNGDYWHSDKFLAKRTNHPQPALWYHEFKQHDAALRGITLAFVWEWDWLNYQPEVEVALLEFIKTGKAGSILTQLETPHPNLRMLCKK